jgi:hypothetical protein
MAGSPFFAFTPIERVALKTIREERPGVVDTISVWLAKVLDDVARTSQGRVVTEADADDLLLRLRDECVGQMLADMEPWDADEDLRESVIDLLARHLLAEARDGFVRKVVAAKRN